jgi:uncharacterized protein
MPGEASAPPERPLSPAWARPLLVAALVTGVVTLLGWKLPRDHQATGVGLGFLFATWWLVLRRDEVDVRRYGLSLGGLFEPSPLDGRRVLRDAGRAARFVLLVSLVVFPPFAIGYPLYYSWFLGRPLHFHFVLPPGFLDNLLGQILVIALPEEAFFRGYLQTALDDAWPPRFRLFGASIGPALLVSSAIFAAGHFFTEPNPQRLAVFFPSLLFGWMRARSGSVGPSLVFHALCNVLSSLLGHAFGVIR